MSAGEGGQHHGEHVMLALGAIARVAHAIEIAPAYVALDRLLRDHELG
jgi:hypothetical protein